MRIVASLVVLCSIVSLALGQWIETTMYLPDSLSGLDTIYAAQFHSPSHSVWLGGKAKVVAVDAGTRRELAGIPLPGPVELLCSVPAGNKLYCASIGRESVWVADCATNSLAKIVRLDGRVWTMCYAAGSNKVYVTCPADSLVDVIDCGTGSVTARIDLKSWAAALCYNPGRNRIYVAKQASDEVAVIDCAADTVISTIWVRGAEPTVLGYDSATNCVYTVNHASGTASVIDCAGDSLVRVVAAGAGPEYMVVGPAGKVYCGGYSDSVVTAIEPQGTHTIAVGRHLSGMSYDPVDQEVYCAMSDSEVVVIDAVGDTVLTRVATGVAPRFVCFDPVDTSTWATGADGGKVAVIDGVTHQLSDILWLGVFEPAALCYSPVSSRLYCLALYRQEDADMLLVIDGDSNHVLKVLPARSSPDSMLWNPFNNKLYFTSTTDNTVSILDCARDSIIAAVQTGGSPNSMCCSDDGKVYVTTSGGVTVVDPDGDSIRTVVATPYDPTSLCYDRTDKKMYASLRRRGLVSVIDAGGDSVVASVAVPESCHRVCWNPNHDKVYVCADYAGLAVIDCTSDTVLRNLNASIYPARVYSDSTSDKIYMCGDKSLYIFDAGTDSLLYSTQTYALSGFLDNGLPGAANRVYCPCYDYRNEGLLVVSGADNYVLRNIKAGEEPRALAWNPVHSWVYVSSSASHSITVVSDTMLGVAETPSAERRAPNTATVVRGVLVLDAVDSRQNTAYRAELLDIAGRVAMKLQPGANDMRALAPGVYFVREAQAQAQAVWKIVLAR